MARPYHRIERGVARVISETELLFPTYDGNNIAATQEKIIEACDTNWLLLAFFPVEFQTLAWHNSQVYNTMTTAIEFDAEQAAWLRNHPGPEPELQPLHPSHSLAPANGLVYTPCPPIPKEGQLPEPPTEANPMVPASPFLLQMIDQAVVTLFKRHLPADAVRAVTIKHPMPRAYHFWWWLNAQSRLQARVDSNF